MSAGTPPGPEDPTLDVTASGSAAPAWGDTQIGRYVFRRLVGSGGMGVVVAAHDPELDREVAIKLVTSRDEAGTGPVREAQAMARLSHPNVVTVYEVLRVGDRSAIVMELVDGEDLAAWRKGQHPAWREVLDAYVQAGRGLAAAHRAGLVHRDFKPSNALIDKTGMVRVTDFGLAGDLPKSSDARGGSVMGTPAYMAPEQHRGGPADARSDQWALACSLYEALYDARPFTGEDRETIKREPSSTPVPRQIRAAIRRALSPEPEKRFASIDELLVALAPSRRGWRVAAATAVLALTGLVFAVIGLRGQPACNGLDAPLHVIWTPSKATVLRARFVASGAGLPADTVDRVIGGLDRYASAWTSARTVACTETHKGLRSKDVLDRRMRCLDQRLAELSGVVDGLVEAAPAALRPASDAVALLHPIVDCDDPQDTVPRPASAKARGDITSAEDTLARAWAFESLGQYERALPMAERALAVGEQTGWTPLTARALVLRGECQDRLRRYADALASYDRAANAAAQAHDPKIVVDALERAFLVRGDHLGRRAEALGGRHFIELALETAGQPPRERAMWLHFLAILLYDDPDVREEAFAAETEALVLWRKNLPPGHVYLGDSLETLGNIQVARGRFDEGEALFKEVLAARIAARGPQDAGVADVLTNLGLLEAQRGRLLAAVDYLTRAGTTAREAHVIHGTSAFNLGAAQFELGRWHAAAESYASSLAAAELQSQGEDSRDVAESAISLGAVEIALGQVERGRPRLQRGLELARRSGSPALAEATTRMAGLALRDGDRAGARARLAEALKLPGGTGPLATLVGAQLDRAEGACVRAEPGYVRAIAEAIKERQRSVQSAATTELAECEVERGAFSEAQPALEAELAWLDGEAHADAAASAPARFALARALAARGDISRGRALATDARAGYAGTAHAADVDRWLARHVP